MNNKVYLLADILPETQSRFPHINIRKFKTLYDCWRAKGIRNKTHSRAFYTYSWKRGWLAENDALALRQYIGLC